jgi:hypothetical protein
MPPMCGKKSYVMTPVLIMHLRLDDAAARGEPADEP